MSDCDCGTKTASNYSPGNSFSDYHGRNIGHPLIEWPGWADNDARYSVQTDIIRVPISPVHFQQWPGMQFQLSNGWQYTNYGQKTPYDDYLRMLSSSTSNPNNVRPSVIPGEGTQPTAFGKTSSLVSTKTIQNSIFVNNEPSMPTGFDRVGKRTFYG